MNEDVIRKVIAHPRFRGLWRSKEIRRDGTVEHGWSVTFVHDGDFAEVAYESTPYLAAVAALEVIGADSRETETGGS